MTNRRLRHKGTGPKRDLIPALHTFDFQLPEDVLSEFQGIVAAHQATDDLNKDHYPIANAKYVELAKHVPDGFRDIALQFHRDGADSMDEKSYTVWNDRLGDDSAIIKFFEDKFPKAFRVRIGHMPSDGGELNWHIDTNSTVAVRVQIPITHAYNESEIEFNLRTKNGVVTAVNSIGDIFMTNTAWPHRVINHTSTGRYTCVFSIEYDDLIELGAPGY